MKSSFFVIIFTILFIILGLFNHDNINEFSYNYLDKFNTIEENVKDENWSKASDLLKTSKDNLEDEKNTWYKLINHEYLNEVFASMEILNQSIYMKDKMICLQEIEKIKMVFNNLMEDECYNFNRIF
ncbi:MAG: DUF4363 family protein [Clostridiales bacterium]|uniref:DUF4363 family protein n=1 Tax=Terrisporobacter sp. TaxID=1965305 RepID=UPI002A4A0D37|nr:DUF4363 family protein [Terrisporobacter sp.]MCI7206804.1 DUF4363 family protein [Clostridium sp.]MDD5879995.1 DUF4363 family protein [Clostridiales bacterium]MDD7755044.1 DUF4363 family protein [Clostridiales bacterium]MDY4135931.1 DUF4363 family protein [Terrisporobacter sp.]MDY4736547.1 DUF4363 family protein [Terrisporobacter sp.]